MKCVYNYNGHTFSSELELDDFLLESHLMYSKFGDIVFDYTPKTISTYNILNDKSKEAHKLKLLESDNAMSGETDIEHTVVNIPGHIGVNSFLQGLKNIEGRYLFPEFIEENYWNEVKPRWAGGKFEPDEAIAIFGLSNITHPIISDDEFNLARDIIKNKWTWQGKIGTELHKIMQMYFDEIPTKGKSNGMTQIRSFDDDFLINQFIPNHLNTKFVPPEVIPQMVKYCRELEKTINNTLEGPLLYLPELHVSGQTSKMDTNGVYQNLVGMIDLLIIDKYGTPHIVDYKTSPKPYNRIGEEEGYKEAKINTFKYQLGVYERLVKKYGINTSNSKLFIAPILTMNFHQEDDRWVYDSIKPFDNIVVDLTENIKDNLHIQENIDEFLPAPFITEASTQNLLKFVTDMMSNWFLNYKSTPDEITDDTVKDLMKKHAKFDNTINKWVYKFKYGNSELTAETEAELFTKLKTRLTSFANNKINLTQTIKEGLSKAIEEENPYYEFITEKVPNDPKSVTGWFRDRMAKYCNRHWEIIDCEPAEYLGCILLRQKETNQIDIIKITASDPKKPLDMIKGRHTLAAMFEDDITAKKKPNSLIAENLVGNVELMEAMLVLNNIPELFKDNAKVGNIVVDNPYFGIGLPMSNEQLLYNFNELGTMYELSSKKTFLNNFKNKSIQMATHVDLFYNKFKEIICKLPEDKNLSRKFTKFIQSLSILDTLMNNPETMRTELMQLRKEFEKEFPNVLKTSSSYDELGQPQIKLYRMITEAIGELDGLKYTQIVKESKRYIDDFYVWVKGLSGLRIDNPGNLNNPLLNKLTSLVTIAYQNVRDTVSRSNGDIRNLVNKLKEDYGFSYLTERTIGNLADLYKKMLIFTDDGDILLRNPDKSPDLTEAERNFLNYFLDTINNNRYSNRTEEELLNWRYHDDPRYFRLPLTRGNMQSIVSHTGLMAAAKEKLQYWNPKKINKEKLLQKMEGFLDPDDEKYKQASVGELWEMTNTFDAGEKEDIRLTLIKKNPPELNLETLLLLHITAYSMKENLDEIFPSLQAIAIHISESGIELNTEFTEDLEYVSDYIKNKVFNISLIDERAKTMHVLSKQIMSTASKLALVFNPAQYYLFIDGIWKVISLAIRKPDGRLSFTKENLIFAFKFVMKDLFHYGNGISLCEAINQLYGLNDMDMNTYAEKMKSDLSGIYNFWSLGFRCSSRPDFYNRMIIFVAQMKGDGCFDAHSMKNGKLVYNWELDKRFSVYAKNKHNPINTSEYKKLEALYLTMAQLLVKEHTRNVDGSLFKIGDALPKAYTTQESESLKALADSIYGYYSHEKKSLIQSTFLGSLLFQMNTYWSSKKNQFLAPGGIKLQGKYVLWIDNGKKVYHKLNENGVPTQEPTYEDTGYPMYVWEGRWEEGILLTMSSVVRDMYNNGLKDGNITEGIHYITNHIWNIDDDNLRQLYRSNLLLFTYDLTMWLAIGGAAIGSLSTFVDLEVVERGNDTLEDAAINTGMELGVRMLKSSAEDFNFIKSVFGRGMQWTPFSIQTLNRTIDTFSGIISGDKSLYEGLINTVAATRATKPIWEYVATELE